MQWNEDKSNATIKQLAAKQTAINLKCGQCEKLNNKSKIDSNIILKFELNLTQS